MSSTYKAFLGIPKYHECLQEKDLSDSLNTAEPDTFFIEHHFYLRNYSQTN